VLLKKESAPSAIRSRLRIFFAVAQVGKSQPTPSHGPNFSPHSSTVVPRFWRPVSRAPALAVRAEYSAHKTLFFSMFF